MKTWHIGCSGFNYSSWKNVFYPTGLKPAEWLKYYSEKFDTVELNSTFYKFPILKNLVRLYDLTPPHFIFSVKAHKIITHSKRMQDVAGKIMEFTGIVEEGLREKLGCILFQLPPSFKYSKENFDHVLNNVPHQSRNVIEFRHESWWKQDVYRLLKENNLTFCSVSFPGLPEKMKATSAVFYLRMHGVPKLFQSSYSSAELKRVAETIPVKPSECFVYFNNTTFEAGFTNAMELKKKTGN